MGSGGVLVFVQSQVHLQTLCACCTGYGSAPIFDLSVHAQTDTHRNKALYVCVNLHMPAMHAYLLLFVHHVLQSSSLDGCVELSAYYALDAATGAWLAPLPLDGAMSISKAACPSCRKPLGHHVKRYGRMVKKV